jgi:NAD(P)H-flavin reductase
MQAQIKEKREVAQGTHLVIFDLLDREVDFEPGLYFFVTLPGVGHQHEKGLRRQAGDWARRSGQRDDHRHQ